MGHMLNDEDKKTYSIAPPSPEHQPSCALKQAGAGDRWVRIIGHVHAIRLYYNVYALGRVRGLN